MRYLLIILFPFIINAQNLFISNDLGAGSNGFVNNTSLAIGGKLFVGAEVTNFEMYKLLTGTRIKLSGDNIRKPYYYLTLGVKSNLVEVRELDSNELIKTYLKLGDYFIYLDFKNTKWVMPFKKRCGCYPKSSNFIPYIGFSGKNFNNINLTAGIRYTIL
jgi:hypothetical protein